MATIDTFSTATDIVVNGTPTRIFSLAALERAGHPRVARLPFALKILLENLLRHEDGTFVRAADITALADWDASARVRKEIAFTPARVLLQDFTGVPCVVDLAAMRDAVVRLGGDPARINPLQPVELVIDHSVQVDAHGRPDAFELNADLEFTRNRERYVFLRWGQDAFANFRVVPPDTGIVHQVNLEYLARVVFEDTRDGKAVAYPDTLVGTDSHTTMVNGLGVVGWGVGGIEAEACMLGQPVSMLVPEVLGVKLTGSLPGGATATDLVLTITERLRKHGVVGKFVEFYGPGLEHLSIADRATLSNMCPEYGATIAVFPIDRTDARLPAADRARRAAHRAGRGVCEGAGAVLDVRRGRGRLRRADRGRSGIHRAVPGRAAPAAGSRDAQPGGRVVRRRAGEDDGRPGEGGQADAGRTRRGAAGRGGRWITGRSVIAAITSCTNTSNPSVMIGAGLLAKKAVERGLRVKPWVKTSLAPGSKAVTRVPQPGGADGIPRSPGLPVGGLRVHDVHRQQRAAAGGRGRRREGARPRGRVRAERQPQLRGAHPVAGARQLPGVAAARRGVRARRYDAHRSDVAAARQGRVGRRRLPEGHLAEREGDRGGDARGRDRGVLPQRLRGRVRRRRAVAGAPGADGRPLRVGRGVDLHPSSAVLRGAVLVARAAGRHPRAPACWRCSATA